MDRSSAGRAHRRVVARAAFAIAMISVAIGCQPASNGQPLLTDPAEIVMAGVRSTAALHTVHARIDMTYQEQPAQQPGDLPGPGNEAMGGRSTIELDIDLATRDFAGRSVNSIRGGLEQTSELIFVGGQQFTRNLPDVRWIQFPNFANQVSFPSNEVLLAGVSSMIEGGGVAFQLADAEACGDATCYHVVADLSSEATWQLLGPVFMGGPATGPPPAGLNLPPVTIHILVDQASRALMVANTVVTLQGVSVNLAINLTNHDGPIAIAPPPPGMVDKMDMNGGGGVVAPQPMPAETPQPAP
jgi:hypothetical protein